MAFITIHVVLIKEIYYIKIRNSEANDSEFKETLKLVVGKSWTDVVMIIVLITSGTGVDNECEFK